MKRQRLQASHVEMVDKMKGEKCRSRLVCREIKKARRTTWTRRCVFTHVAVGRVENARVNNDDGNHADGPFEMATWDVSRAHYLPEGTQRQHGERDMVRSVEGWFHGRRNRVPTFL